MKSQNMIGIAMYTTILTLHKQGISQRQILKITNIHRRTINKIITKYEDQNIETPIPSKRLSKVELWHERKWDYWLAI
jgi:transposase